MNRSALAMALCAAIIAPAWLGLEQRPWPAAEASLIIAFSFLPAFVIRLGRRRWSNAVNAAAASVAFVVATAVTMSIAFDVSLAAAPPGDEDRGFLGVVAESFREGFVQFFTTELPFSRVDYPFMHGVVMTASFGFVAVAAMAAVTRRPIGAAAVLVAGAGWPTTMNSLDAPRPLAIGAATLLGVLGVLFLLRDRGRLLPTVAEAAALALLIVVVSVIASTSGAVAKGAMVRWQDWDVSDPPQKPVGVDYVWNSNYDGISFPEKKTVVFKVKVAGPKRSLYWRATTLDEYTGRGWREALDAGTSNPADEISLAGRDALLPDEASDDENWVRQDVEVVAFRGNHLIGSAQPVKWTPGTSRAVRVARNGAVIVDEGLRAGQRYSVWSYVPRPKPSELAEAPTAYPSEVLRFLEFPSAAGALPSFREPRRRERMDALFGSTDSFTADHRGVYRIAQSVTADARSPYDAAVALEAWFRSDGGFVYDESPPPYHRAPLVEFVLEDKAGYCQQFAGAMAMMLRLLGIPARVAAGFTSGTYDPDEGVWIVTDHNAHTWVEIYFPDFGWIPFDPTPNRGELTAPYTPFSAAFDGRDASSALGSAARLDAVRSQLRRPRRELDADTAAPVAPANPVESPSARARAIVLGITVGIASGVAVLLLTKELRRRTRFLARDPKAIARACRYDLAGFLADQGIRPSASMTISELGELVESQFGASPTRFVESVGTARFGPPTGSHRASRRARAELRKLRRELRSQLTVQRRIRGALNVRSLARRPERT